MQPSSLSPDDRDKMREGIAGANGFAPYKRYSEAEAAGFLGIHPQTLKETRLQGRIPYLRLGTRRISYLGIQIADYIIGSIQWDNPQKMTSASASTGSGEKAVETPITATGTIRSEESRAAHLLARQTLKKPKTS
ncbi:MAG: hypothetical protein ABJH52_09655 [Henriciella sp.]